MSTETIILCEGYDDRAFLAGWLLRLGLNDLKPDKGRATPIDPWGLPVSDGQFAFRAPDGGSVRVQPCHSRGNVFRRAKLRVKGAPSRALAGLVLAVDHDGVDPTPQFDGVTAKARKLGVGNVNLAVWHCEDPATDGVPDAQTLERVVCAAIVAAYPLRGPSVQTWVAGRPDCPVPKDEVGHKTLAWSHMAGWYSRHGCGDFYRAVWRDERVATALEDRLTANGAAAALRAGLDLPAPT